MQWLPLFLGLKRGEEVNEGECSKGVRNEEWDREG